ncbi:hypothetical protein Tco_0424446 [Tanacetum coccineum]
MNDHLKAHRDFQQVMDDSMSKLHETFQTWLQQRQEQVVNLDTYTHEPSQCRKIPICYDDDDDEYSFATQEYLKKFSPAITPDLPKSDSLIMEDKHLDTIPKTESDELIKSSVEDLVHTLSESNGISESECDLPVCDDSSPKKDEVLDDIILEYRILWKKWDTISTTHTRTKFLLLNKLSYLKIVSNVQEVSGSLTLLEISGSSVGLESIQEEDT